MAIEYLIKKFSENVSIDAIVWNNEIFKYRWLLQKMQIWEEKVLSKGILPGSVVAVQAEFSPNSIALFLILLKINCIVVPLTFAVEGKKDEYLDVAEVEHLFVLDREDNVSYIKRNKNNKHPLCNRLREIGHPGLILFSSGSTGKSKAALHDMLPMLEKFQTERHAFRAISFLLYDHIGGVNTLLYILSNAGLLVTVPSRAPDVILSAVEKYGVELLPTTPTFLNLLLLSESYKNYNLKSLKVITYGTEPMPESLLKRINQIFPNVKLQQTYGLSELGILRSKSRSNESLWVKIGGEGFETRVVDGELEIKAKTTMIGYLNAESPITEDGWFRTGDAVEVDGEWMKILGRRSELINVGGEKVYPQEVENVLMQMDEIQDITVYSEPHMITGNIVCAKIVLKKEVDEKEFKLAVKRFCSERLQKFKVPVKIKFVTELQYNDRFKKARSKI